MITCKIIFDDVPSPGGYRSFAYAPAGQGRPPRSALGMRLLRGKPGAASACRAGERFGSVLAAVGKRLEAMRRSGNELGVISPEGQGRR